MRCRGLAAGAERHAGTALLIEYSVGAEVQKRRARTRARLQMQLQQSGRTIATALREDITEVLMRVPGRTRSRDGELRDLPATQALQNVLGDLRMQMDMERDSRVWMRSEGAGNPARSPEAEALMAGYGKLLLDHGITVRTTPPMTEDDAKAWMDAARGIAAREHTPSGRLRALRNFAYGSVQTRLGGRSIDVLRLDSEGVLERDRASIPALDGTAGERPAYVLLFMPGKSARRSNQRGRQTTTEVVLQRQAERRCAA
jgi:hypothetical protein